MTQLHEILDPAVLDAAVAARLVQVRRDEDTGLLLYNYTAQAQWQRAWDQATLSCRGLICSADGTVLARPWPKFFNLEELDGFPDGTVEVTEKLDGSLGILYRRPDGRLAIATRGSFVSEQARHATSLLEDRYAQFEPVEGWTYLFEIIYPANRIVVEYDFDDLVLLGAVDTASGRSVEREVVNSTWPGRCVEVLEHTSLAEALGAPDRVGAEGMVVHHLASDTRVKIKQAEYKRLHRLVTGLSEKAIWEILREGRDLGELLGAVPDEFYDWVQTVSTALLGQHAELCEAVAREHAAIVERIGSHEQTPEGERARRKAYAGQAARHPLAAALFSTLDGRDIAAGLWDRLEPNGSSTFKAEPQ